MMTAESMRRIIASDINPRHYQAAACIVWCFDNRFSNLLDKLVAKESYGNIDLIKVAGGAKSLASPSSEAERDYLLDQIAKSIKLHQPPIIALMVHANCAAYGQSFESEEAEQAFYANELEKAETAVKPKISAEVEVEKYFANFSGLCKT